LTWLSTRAHWENRDKAILILLFLFILLGAVLRIYNLGTESIWLDEAESIYESTLSFTEISAHSNQPPLYFVILSWWIRLWGTGEIALRSLSAVFGILAILITFFVGKELFSRKVGLIGCFIAAISQFQIFYSQDARAYSLLLLLSLISYMFFIKILKQNKNWYYPCFFLATSLLAYTHIYGLFIIASQVLYFLIFWKNYQLQRIKLISTVLVLLISILPLIVLLGPNVMRVTEGGFWIPQPSLGSMVETLLEYAAGFAITQISPDTTDGTFYTAARYILLIIFLTLAVLSPFHLGRRTAKKTGYSSKKQVVKSGPEPNKELLLLVLWLCLTIVVPFVASQIITPFYVTRYTIGASPALYLLAAKGISNFGRKSLILIIVVVIIFSSFGLQNYYKTDIKEQWREAADLVETSSKEGDAIVFCTYYVRRPFNYYYEKDLPEYGIDADASDQEIIDLVDDVDRAANRLWLVVSNVSELPPILGYLKDKYTLVDWSGFRGIIVFLFDLS